MRTLPLSLLLAAGLGLSALAQSAPHGPEREAARSQAGEIMEANGEAISAGDLRRHLEALCSEGFEGRGTSLKGGWMATEYAAACFKSAGLQPAGNGNDWFQSFPFLAGFDVDKGNTATVDWGGGVMESLVMKDTYTPLTFSPDGKIDAADIVFAGFGCVGEDYDSYEGLDVKGKWVMTFRGAPAFRERALRDQGPLIAKAKLAAERGAAGMIFVKGDNEKIPGELVQLRSVGQRGRILPSVSVRNRIANSMLGTNDLSKTFAAFNDGNRIAGFPLATRLEAEFSIKEAKSTGRNVIGVLPAGEKAAGPAVVICAHIDHLGFGTQGGSRAKGKARQLLHPGADDNASGSATLFEIAEHLAARKQAGNLQLRRDILFIAFSGEELGIYGSNHFVKDLQEAGTLTNRIHACINLDMIGRLRENRLNVNGTGSSRAWNELLDEVTQDRDLELKRNARAPAGDSLPFERARIPSLFAITGMHDDYHTPADTVDMLNIEGLASVAAFIGDLAVATANREGELAYQGRANLAPPPVVVGIVPEDAEGGGVRIASVSDRFPADEAGLKTGDIILRLKDAQVKNTEDLFKVLRTMKPEVAVKIVVRRGKEELTLELTPDARK